MASWQKIYETSNLQRAQIVLGVLEANDMHPIMINKKDSAYLFGICEIRVDPDEVIKALKIIEEEVSFE